MRPSKSAFFVLAVATGGAAGACKKGEAPPDTAASASASASAAPAPENVSLSKGARTAAVEWVMPDGPIVGAINGQANIYKEPNDHSARLGYLRLGAVVSADAEPAGKANCPGGWHKLRPQGYICVGADVTTDRAHPMLRATTRMKPDTGSALPYRYGFVRATLPLYLRAPNKDDQEKSEFKLKDHLEKWESQKDELNKVILGAYDVPVDERGYAILGKKPGDVPRPSTTWTQAELFGGLAEDDAVPWWLEGGRKIPNVADFKVGPSSIFADRARRHTGLAFIGSFQLGADGNNRRFGITTDLRLAPTSKVKPDSGSPFHGIELGPGVKAPPLPFAWVRVSDVKAYKLVDGKPREKGALEKRSIVLLTGKKTAGPDDDYWELSNGQYIRAAHASVVAPPPEWPEAAKKGQKWIDVSIVNQTLVLYEGQKPVYATMVSTGRDKLGDPKTTHSTVRGTFTIKSKHVTATMDSNEGLGGKKAKEKDPEYGVTKRRGEGQFWLRDVPYVQYFEKGYALHVAYWHDVFGLARSHGCINLSPIDGKIVFAWTDPKPPEGWHGVMSGEMFGEGTVVHVRE